MLRCKTPATPKARLHRLHPQTLILTLNYVGKYRRGKTSKHPQSCTLSLNLDIASPEMKFLIKTSGFVYLPLPKTKLRHSFKAPRRIVYDCSPRIVASSRLLIKNKKYTGDRSNKREVILTVVSVRSFDIFRSNSRLVFELRTCQVCLCLWHCHGVLEKISNIQALKVGRSCRRHDRGGGVAAKARIRFLR
mgnify:CR=1 FL=1